MAYGGESDINKWFPTTGPVTDTYGGRHPFADIPFDLFQGWHICIILGVELGLIAITFAFTYWWYRILERRDDDPRIWFKPRITEVKLVDSLWLDWRVLNG